MNKIAQIEKSYMRNDHPRFGSGDTVRVHYRIVEGNKERIQVFQGTVIGRRGGGTGETFTVRKISSGVGVERVFPYHSPNIARIERIRVGKVRRKKLYYLRELTGKSARIKEQLMDKNSLNETDVKEPDVQKETQVKEVKAEAAEVKEETKTEEVKTEEAKSEEATSEEEKTEKK